MKVVIEIDYELDGQEPDRKDIARILSDTLFSAISSEDVGKPELWALFPKECLVTVLK